MLTQIRCSEWSQDEETAEHQVYSLLQPDPEELHLWQVQDAGIGLAHLHKAL